MSQGFGQGGGFGYQPPNNGWGQNQGFNNNQGWGQNQGYPNQNQGWNNNTNQGWNNSNQGWGQQPQTQGWGQNQGWGQGQNQGWNNNSNQGWGQGQNQGWSNGSTSGWGNQGYSGNTWGPTTPHGWYNPFGLSLPQVTFIGGCRKCGGNGTITRRGRQIPCRRGYRSHGFCVKWYGTGVNFMRNKPCHKCHGTGHKVKRHHKHRSSSSSSDSDW